MLATPPGPVLTLDTALDLGLDAEPDAPATTLPTSALARDVPLPPSPMSRAPDVIDAETLADVLDTGNVLVIDLRPRTAFRSAHIAGSVNLCLPGTLLRRATYTMDKAVQSVVADSDRLRLETWTCVARIVLCDGCPPNPTCASHAGESFPLPATGRRAPPPPCPVAPMAAKLASAPARLSVLKGGFTAFAKACPAYVESSTVPGTPIAQKDGFALRMAALPTPTLQLNAPPLASARARTPATSTRPSSTVGTPSVAGSRVVPPSPFADPPAVRSPFADPPAARSPFADPLPVRSPFADPPGLGAMRSPVRTPGSARSPGPSTPGRERPPSLAARRGFNATLSTPGGTSSAASTASTPGPGLFTGKPASLHRRKPRPPNLNLALSSSSSGWPPPPLPGLPQAKQLKLLCTLAAKDLPPTAPKWLHDLFASGGIISELQTKFMGVLMADGRVNSPTLALSSKNRYGNVFPFQHNRVQLLHRDPELGPSEADSDYINASYIRVSPSVLPAAIDHPDPCPTFLATQAPLPHTTRDFWAMVRDQECPVIVNLAASMDHSRGSAHGYWPENAETPLVYVVEGGRELEVQLVSEAVAIVSDGIDDPPPSVTLRRLRVSTTPPGRSIDVAHVSVEGWEDGNIPSVDSALAVVRLLRDELDTARARGNPPDPLPAGWAECSVGPPCPPVVVHCSAGCGRTGTFVAVYALAVRWLDLTRPLPKVILPVDTDPVPPLVRHLREQRMMMVQTHTQFMFLYEVLVSWATLGYNPIVPQFSITVPPVEEVGVEEVGVEEETAAAMLESECAAAGALPSPPLAPSRLSLSRLSPVADPLASPAFSSTSSAPTSSLISPPASPPPPPVAVIHGPSPIRGPSPASTHTSPTGAPSPTSIRGPSPTSTRTSLPRPMTAPRPAALAPLRRISSESVAATPLGSISAAPMLQLEVIDPTPVPNAQPERYPALVSTVGPTPPPLTAPRLATAHRRHHARGCLCPGAWSRIRLALCLPFSRYR